MELQKLASILESVNVATFQPGDVLVYKLNKRMDVTERLNLLQTLEALFGTPRVLLLDPGCDIALARPGTTPASDEPEARTMHRPINGPPVIVR